SFVHDTATSEIYTLSLHDALPIFFSIFRCIGQIEVEQKLNPGIIWRPKFRPWHFLPQIFGLRNWQHLPRHVCRRHQRQWVCPLRSEEHTSELQSRENLVCRLLLEK